MNLFDLTINQLKRAAAIKEQIDVLNKELAQYPQWRQPNLELQSKKTAEHERLCEKENCRCSKSKMGKASKVLNQRRIQSNPPRRPRRRRMSPATRAKLSAKLKAYWAAKKSGKK